jgi:hypothetical protein
MVMYKQSGSPRRPMTPRDTSLVFGGMPLVTKPVFFTSYLTLNSMRRLV